MVKHYSFSEAFVSLSLNESLEEGIGHSSSLRSGAREIRNSLGLTIPVTALFISHGDERQLRLFGGFWEFSIGCESCVFACLWHHSHLLLVTGP